MNISYDIVEEQVGQLFDIKASFSMDDGMTFKPLKSVKGDIGKNIEGGVNNIIVWETLKMWKKLMVISSLKLMQLPKILFLILMMTKKYHYQIKSLHYDDNKLWAVFNIRNDADQRELKVINGKVTITDFNGKNTMRITQN